MSAYSDLVTESYPGGLFGDEDWRSTPEGAGVESRLPLSRGAKRLVVLMLVLAPAAWMTGIVVRIEMRTPRNPAVVAAEGRLVLAEVNAVTVNTCNFRCEKAHVHALGEAYFRFASSISHISFPRPQRRAVVVVTHDARKMGQLMLAASKSKDGGRAMGIDPADAGDSPLAGAFDAEVESVLGPEPY